MSSSSVAATSSFSQVSAHSMGFCSTSSISSPFHGPVIVDRMGFLQSTLRARGQVHSSFSLIFLYFSFHLADAKHAEVSPQASLDPVLPS
ncbi:hypothetical protein N7489_003187, partial [Penicillium chrysogenum]|uniref:uncharacterized protein n=1 Tax=Penicillium chrysogenum TaxID=5076 RepID=UPI0024DF3064